MLRRMKGFTLIELLIVVAIIAILAAIAVPNFLEAQTRSKVARVKGDQRTITIALETYYLDNNSYPAQDSSMPNAQAYGANLGLNKTTAIACMPTFRNKTSSVDPLLTLTTPVAYITSYFADPFADTKGATFSYSVGRYGIGYMIWSFGPDSDENSVETYNQPSGAGGDLDVAIKDSGYPTTAGSWPSRIAETTYNPAINVPSDRLISETYDPTNGTSSSGDVYRIKQ